MYGNIDFRLRNLYYIYFYVLDNNNYFIISNSRKSYAILFVVLFVSISLMDYKCYMVYTSFY